MRKFLLASLCIALIATATNAQVIAKGQKMIGGSIGFSTAKDESQMGIDYKQNYIYIAPTFAKAINKNLLLGASISFSKYKSNQDFSNSSNFNSSINNSIGAELFLEKFYPLVNNFSISAKAGINGGHFVNEQKNGYATEYTIAKRNGFYTGASLEPALNYLFSKRLLAQFYLNDMVAFRYENGKKTETNMAGTQTKNYNNISFSSSLNGEKALSNFTLSFRYLLK